MIPSLDDIGEVAIGFVIATVALASFYALVGVSDTGELADKIRNTFRSI